NLRDASGTLTQRLGHTLNGAVNQVEDHAVGAFNNVENTVATAATLPGAFMKGSTECPKIIEKTNWEQYLGLAPLAAAINKQCSWK
ncbi:hypothetical protein MMC16_000218, partial [Acarospora aff. strigata]|nr:hypothetical protein [Acarospora aff. strigata]